MDLSDVEVDWGQWESFADETLLVEDGEGELEVVVVEVGFGEDLDVDLGAVGLGGELGGAFGGLWGDGLE